jgi:hypothetical protein
MIQNHNPNDWKDWDKSMSRYQQRLDKNSRAFRWFIAGLIGVIILITCLSALYSIRLARKATNLPEHQGIDTAWIEEHSEIPEDTATFTTKVIRRKSVDSLYRLDEDSIVKYGSKSLWMYHGSKIVAIRPNKTWDWLVLDSVGYKIAIVKAKRRDSL